MQCVEELSPEALFDLDEIEAPVCVRTRTGRLPAFDAPALMPDAPAIAFGFAETATTSATTCTVSVTLVAENPYDGVLCYAQSPFGLDAFDTTANFFAGAGDVLSFGVTKAIRNSFPDFYAQDYSSGAYKGGEWTGMGYSLALGGGRLAYAGAAKGGSMVLLRQGATEANALKAMAMRNSLKTTFNLGLLSKDELMTAERMAAKYGSDWARWINAAGRTSTESSLFGINGSWNALGGYFFGAGVKGLYEQSDDCK